MPLALALALSLALPRPGAAALPWSVCPYQQKSDWDPKTKTGLSDRLCVAPTLTLTLALLTPT